MVFIEVLEGTGEGTAVLAGLTVTLGGAGFSDEQDTVKVNKNNNINNLRQEFFKSNPQDRYFVLFSLPDT